MIRQRSENVRVSIPWLLLSVFVIIPTLVGTVALAIRSGLFRRGPVTNNELKVLWTFAGVAVAGAVSLTGYLITNNQHRTSERRLALDTTVSGLKLLTSEDGSGYAPKAVMSGALATLIHLHQPVIAMRALSAAWADQAIDPPSAVWLISEVMTASDDKTQLEAAIILSRHIDDLCGDDPGDFNWPGVFMQRWDASMPLDARLWVLYTLLKMLISKPYSWWSESGASDYIVGTLDEALLKDSNSFVQTYAAKSLNVLLASGYYAHYEVVTSLSGDKAVQDMQRRIARVGDPGENDLLEDLIRQLQDWSRVTTSNPPDVG